MGKALTLLGQIILTLIILIPYSLLWAVAKFVKTLWGRASTGYSSKGGRLRMLWIMALYNTSRGIDYIAGLLLWAMKNLLPTSIYSGKP